MSDSTTDLHRRCEHLGRKQPETRDILAKQRISYLRANVHWQVACKTGNASQRIANLIFRQLLIQPANNNCRYVGTLK